MTSALSSYRRALIALLSIALVGLSHLQSVQAGTIIKLGLGSDTAADLRFDGTTLHTLSDGGPGVGDQQTDVGYLGILSGEADIPTAIASFTLAGLTPVGAPTIFGGNAFIQDFQNGSFSLFSPSDALLLSGTLSSSLLSGAVSTGSGGVFTTTFGAFTGGSLAPQLNPSSLTLSISLEDAGFSFPGGNLGAFSANGQVTIGADAIPEPTSIALALLGGVAILTIARRRS